MCTLVPSFPFISLSLSCDSFLFVCFLMWEGCRYSSKILKMSEYNFSSNIIVSVEVGSNEVQHFAAELFTFTPHIFYFFHTNTCTSYSLHLQACYFWFWLLFLVSASLQISNQFKSKQRHMKGSPVCVLIARACSLKTDETSCHSQGPCYWLKVQQLYFTGREQNES